MNKRLKTAAESFLLSRVTPVASLIFLLLSSGIKAQKSEGYDPMDLHSDKSRTLIQDVNAQILGEEIEGGSLKSNFWLQGAQHDQALFLTKHIKLGLFIQNDSLQAFVDQAMGRIVSSNRLPERRRIMLIMNTPEANAVCFGQGLFIVTVGLLGKVHNEAELTFILSHEVAHDELQHVQEKLRREAETRTTKRTRYAFYNLLTNDIRQEDIDSFRALMYTSSSFNRSKETEADSLGFIYYKSTSFPAYGALDAMDVLERWKEPKRKVANLFAPLNFTKYPFKSHWTDKRLQVYSQKPGNTFLFSYDSILSHPEMELRKKNIRSLMKDSDTKTSDQVLQVSPAITASEFQSVEAAYQRRQYDLCFFQILQLLNHHPGNSYLVSRGAKLLIEIYHAKNENRLDELVPRYTREYSNELLEVNNLLFNLSKEEAAEMAFHLVNNQGNFDPNRQAHYFLLATICDLTLRSETKQRVESAYRSRFGEQVENFEYK